MCDIKHHCAVSGVTGSCHQLSIAACFKVLGRLIAKAVCRRTHAKIRIVHGDDEAKAKYESLFDCEVLIP
jgi:hypothetical protein